MLLLSSGLARPQALSFIFLLWWDRTEEIIHSLNTWKLYIYLYNHLVCFHLYTVNSMTTASLSYLRGVFWHGALNIVHNPVGGWMMDHLGWWCAMLCLVAQSCPTATPWTIAHRAPLSMGFSRQEYWSRLPCPPQGIFPTQRSNPGLLNCRQILYCLTTREAQEYWSGYLSLLQGNFQT